MARNVIVVAYVAGPPNVTYQLRRALRAVGCMRLFGTRWKRGEDADIVSLDHSVRPQQ